MPTSTAITASSGACARERGEHRGAGDAAPAVVGGAAAPSRPPTARRRAATSAALVGRVAARAGSASASSARGDADVAPAAARSTGWNWPSCSGSRSTWIVGWPCVDAGVVRERRAEHEQAVGLVHQPATRPACRCGRARRTASGWSSGTRPLALKVVITGASRCSASAIDVGSMPRGRRVPAMITGRSRAGEQRRPPRSSASAGGAIAQVGDAALGPRRGSRRARAASCTSSGKTRWATPRSQHGVLARRAPPARRGGSACSTVWLQLATAPNAPLQVDLLEGARRRAPATSTWPVSASTGARSTLRVPQAGQQVGRAGPGDRQARRGPAGELAVGRGGERGGALVADADEASARRPPRGGAARRRARGWSGRPSRRRAVTPHATSVSTITSETVRSCGASGGHADLDAVVAHLDRERSGRVAEPGGGCRSAGSSRSRATGSAAARSRSCPRRAARPGAGSGCRARRSWPSKCVSATLMVPRGRPS